MPGTFRARLALAVLAATPAGAAETARAAVAFDARSSGSMVGTQVAFVHTVGTRPDRYLVVAVGVPANDAAVSVTLDGQALARIGTHSADPFFPCRAELWAMVAPPPGPHTVTVTYGRSLAIRAAAATYDGVDQASPARPHTSVSSTGDQIRLDVPSAAGEVVLDTLCVYKTGNPPTASAAAGQTPRWAETGTNMLLAGSDRAAAGSPVTMSWMLDQGRSSSWAIGAISLRPAMASADAGAVVGGDAGDGPGDRGPPSPDGASSFPDSGAPASDATGTVTTGAVDLAVGCACRLGEHPRHQSGLATISTVAAAAFAARRRRRR